MGSIGCSEMSGFVTPLTLHTFLTSHTNQRFVQGRLNRSIKSSICQSGVWASNRRFAPDIKDQRGMCYIFSKMYWVKDFKDLSLTFLRLVTDNWHPIQVFDLYKDIKDVQRCQECLLTNPDISLWQIFDLLSLHPIQRSYKTSPYIPYNS